MARAEDGYMLLDAGEEEKLELLGPYRVSRQAAQAHWPKERPALWRDLDAVHQRAASGGGSWAPARDLPESWPIRYGPLQFLVKLTDFGHIGLFPEQLDQWHWLERHAGPGLHALNMFGYTGGGTLAAARGGARVTHLDASRGAVAWARENAALNGLAEAPVRWIVEDAVKYLRREVRRGTRYQGLALDPPSFGRGPSGQVWKIERDLTPLLSLAKELLDPLRFVLLSCHTPGYTPACLANLLHLSFGAPMAEIEAGEMIVPYGDEGLTLPSGAYARWANRDAA